RAPCRVGGGHARRRLHRSRLSRAVGRRERGGRRVDPGAGARAHPGYHPGVEPPGCRPRRGTADRPLPPGRTRRDDVRHQEAGATSVLSMRWDDWTADDDVAVVGVGAGLTWASYLLRF